MSEQLEFHPLADLFPLMEGEEFDSLVADIKANGLREKIDLYQGKIVDGRNRYRALRRLGIDPNAEDKLYFRKAIYAHSNGGEIAPHEQSNDDRVRAYVISKNIHRRHLTAEQKRDLLVKLVAAQPEKADRVLAREAKVDHKQISRARRKAEATGAVAPVEKRVGGDGKARKEPEKKLNAVGKPYSPQYDPEYKVRARPVKAPDRGRGDVVQDMVSVLSGLTEFRRAAFFTVLWDKFRDELIEAQTTSHKGNGADPEASAETRKAQNAALDISEPATAS